MDDRVQPDATGRAKGSRPALQFPAERRHTESGGGAATLPESGDIALRELMAVREIAHAFLTADRPQEVFQFALDRVSPVVGATFASVYLVDGASELMKLVAAYNWPERYRPWLGDMRVRLGFGPSGAAAGEKRSIQIPDVFADPSLEDWQEVAEELGFRALVALPLQTRTRVLGAVTFYFADAGGFGGEQRGLLRIVADQMAATAEKAELIEELQRANAALVESNAELERQYVAVIEARRLKDEFLANVSHELRTPLTAVMGYIALMQEELSGPVTAGQAEDLAQAKTASERLLDLIDNLLELTTLKRGAVDFDISEFDPRDPLRDAADKSRGRPAAVALRLDEPTVMLPPMRSDRGKITKIVMTLLGNAYKFTSKGEVRLSLEVRGGRAVYTVQDTGIGIPPSAHDLVFDEFRQLDGSATRRYGGSGLGLALSRRLAHLLGGEISLESTPGEGSRFSLDVPLEMPEAAASAPRAPTL
jgi:signal transduction histidine kinase